jgi:tellurite resistance protein
MSEQARKNLRNVMVFAMADSTVSDEEKQYIQRMRDRLKLNADEFSELVQQATTDPRTLTLPDDPAALEEAVRVLVDTAKADGDVNRAEEKILRNVGLRAGLPPTRVEYMIRGEARDELEDEITERVDELYAHFHEWDDETRRRKCEELRNLGRPAITAMLRVLESYRTPDDAPDALELKTWIAEHIGLSGDTRAVYYLAQQVGIGDSNDETTGQELREACAEAIGRLIDRDFGRNQQGIEAAREWWRSEGRQEHTQLVI